MASRSILVLTARKGSRTARIGVALCAALALALPGTVVAADPPIVVHDELDFTAFLPGLTNACGYPVFSHVEGTVQIVVHYDAAGNPDREVDAGALMRTFFSPETGRSATFPLHANSVADYEPDGSGIAQVTGLAINVHSAGGPPVRFVTGREVWAVQIFEIRPDGVPVADFFELLSKSGPDLGTAPDICLALDP
jgi:hypothetical protein